MSSWMLHRSPSLTVHHHAHIHWTHSKLYIVLFLLIFITNALIAKGGLQRVTLNIERKGVVKKYYNLHYSLLRIKMSTKCQNKQ